MMGSPRQHRPKAERAGKRHSRHTADRGTNRNAPVTYVPPPRHVRTLANARLQPGPLGTPTYTLPPVHGRGPPRAVTPPRGGFTDLPPPGDTSAGGAPSAAWEAIALSASLSC